MGLDAKIELNIEGRKIMVVSVHPQTSMEAVADMLEDLAADIRRDLTSRTPVLSLHQRRHEIDTTDNSPTPSATFCGKSIGDRFDSAVEKFIAASDYGDAAMARKYWDISEKLNEWRVHNYTPEAIENGPVPDINNASRI